MGQSMTVVKTADFEVTGDGSDRAWQATSWVPLAPIQDPAMYPTRAKVLWSDAGIYFLMDAEDRTLTCTLTEFASDIFTEDVFEVFLWPDESQNVYFEYEISPLNVELPILVSNHEGRFMGWLPWKYAKERTVRHATAARGGPKAAGASVTGWSAEFFIPFALLKGCGNTPPRAGSRWRANLYRIDYDSGKGRNWAWDPATSWNFHDFRKFGTLVFA